MKRKIIVLRGNSGSGKSTIAYELRKQTEPMALVIEQDLFRQKLVAQKGKEARNFTKEIMCSIVKMGLESGRDVIIEGIFVRDHWQDLFASFIKTYDADFHFFSFILTSHSKRRYGGMKRVLSTMNLQQIKCQTGIVRKIH